MSRPCDGVYINETSVSRDVKRNVVVALTFAWDQLPIGARLALVDAGYVLFVADSVGADVFHFLLRSHEPWKSTQSASSLTHEGRNS